MMVVNTAHTVHRNHYDESAQNEKVKHSIREVASHSLLRDETVFSDF